MFLPDKRTPARFQSLISGLRQPRGRLALGEREGSLSGMWQRSAPPRCQPVRAAGPAALTVPPAGTALLTRGRGTSPSARPSGTDSWSFAGFFFLCLPL